MKVNSYCISCQIRRQEQKIRQCDDAGKKTFYMKEVCRLMADADEDACAPSLSASFRKLYRDVWHEPPEDYTAIHREVNQLVMDLLPTLEKRIRAAQDPLKDALVYARIGNYIDFSALPVVDKNTLLSLIDTEEKEDPEPLEYNCFLKDLSSASSLVYLTDNCGEIVLDSLVVQLLRERYPDLSVTVVVRGTPVANDATIEDAVFCGMDRIARVIGNGSDIAGTHLPSVSGETRTLLTGADVILSKGQGNFETLNGCGLNVYYLFLCKCELFQMRFHAKPLQGMFLNERRIGEVD